MSRHLSSHFFPIWGFQLPGSGSTLVFTEPPAGGLWENLPGFLVGFVSLPEPSQALLPSRVPFGLCCPTGPLQLSEMPDELCWAYKGMPGPLMTLEWLASFGRLCQRPAGLLLLSVVLGGFHFCQRPSVPLLLPKIPDRLWWTLLLPSKPPAAFLNARVDLACFA